MNKDYKVPILKPHTDNLDPYITKLEQMIIKMNESITRLEQQVYDIIKCKCDCACSKNPKSKSKKEVKIDVVERLNSRVIPEMIFDDLIEVITVTKEDILDFLDNSFITILNAIFARTIYKTSNNYPIVAVDQNPNIFYVYDEEDKWNEMSHVRLRVFLDKVHTKIYNAYSSWKQSNANEIQQSSTLSIKCDAMLLKLMEVEFRQEKTLLKTRNKMYTRMCKSLTTC